MNQPGSRRHIRTRARAAATVAAAVAVLTAAACSSSSGTTGTGAHTGGSVKVAVIGPMTGPAAEIGSLMTSACAAAEHEIGVTGGPLGTKLSCDAIDDTGDPADAVPDVTRALATTSGLTMAVGLESNTAATTVPIINDAHIPMFSTD